MEGQLTELFSSFEQETRRLGITLSRHQVDQFRRYLRELREWNRVVRLVSQDEPDHIVWLHFIDSLSPLPYINPGGTLLDIGSGAGFPGLPLKIAEPTIRLHIVEARRRRVHFLKHVVRALDLADATIHPRRLKPGDVLGPFQTIIFRALSPPSRSLPLAAPLMTEDGQLILMLGPTANLLELETTMKDLALQQALQVDFKLPVLGHRRRLIVLRRSRCFT